jgi:regulator of sigma E protease
LLNLLAFDIANAAKTLIGIGGLIFVHELGHFLVGRWCGVRAEAFSIGFGPVLLRWQPGETEYRLSAIPLGGYVKFLGESTEDGAMEALENAAPASHAPRDPVRDRSAAGLDPRSFHAASYPRKVAIMLAGVTMNVIAAFLLFVCAFQSGVQVIAPVVGAVTPGLPAEKAGLRPGDRVVTLNGYRVLDFEDVAHETAVADEADVVVLRDGVELPPIRVPTIYSEEQGHRVMGISPPRDFSGDVGIAPGAAGDAPVPAGIVHVVSVDGRPVADLTEALKVHRAAQGPTVRWSFSSEKGPSAVDLPARVWRLGVAPRQEDAPGEGLLVSTEVDGTSTGPARSAGLPPRARILSADGEPVKDIAGLKKAVTAAGEAGREVAIRWRPAEGGTETETGVRPARSERPEDLGIGTPYLRDTVREENVLSAAVLGLDRTHRWVTRILSTLRALVTGGVSARKLQGPLKLAQSTYETADTGWQYLLLFLGMISMNLAVLNVLPVPLLDGGQLALITAEKLRGRPLPERVVEGIQWTGLALLLSFTLFVIVNDIRSF